METILKDFPLVIEIPVAWGDMDSFLHVNNTVYFRYFESSRIACFERLGIMEEMERTGIGAILHSTQCRFRIPLTYPDTVLVGTKIQNIEEDRFTTRHTIYSRKHEKIAAEGEGVIVAFDYRENRKTLIPDNIRKKIEELEKL